jgi:hypothetical protein
LLGARRPPRGTLYASVDAGCRREFLLPLTDHVASSRTVVFRLGFTGWIDCVDAPLACAAVGTRVHHFSRVFVNSLALPSANPDVIFKPVAEGAVLFSVKDEVYYGLNAVGMRIWQLLPPVHSSVDELCGALRTDYPQVDPAVLRVDVVELLDELTALGLLQTAESNDERPR